MGGARKFAVLLLALACAAALAACGSGGDSTSSTSASAPAPTEVEETSGNAPAKEAGGAGESKGSGKEGSSGEPQPGESTGSSEEGEVSPHDRSAPFRTKGGDNSIQNFGGEESSSERAKATKALTVFFSASKAKEWNKVCSVLSAKARGEMEAFAKQSPKLKGKDCAGVIEVIYSSSPAGSARPEAIKGPVIALRRKGGQAFALYHGSDGKNYAFPLILEGGEWKLIGMGATPLSGF